MSYELFLVVILFTLIMYFLPSLIAWVRGSKHLAGIIILNLFLGITGLGWVGALIWAVSDSCHPIQAGGGL